MAELDMPDDNCKTMTSEELTTRIAALERLLGIQGDI